MLKGFIRSFNDAMKGIDYVFTTQKNMRIHTFIAFIILLLSVYFRLNCCELFGIIIVICFVLISEMINTVIEEIVNLVTPTRRDRAAIAKNVAAGTVLFASICAIIVGCLIFIPHLINMSAGR